MEQKLPVVAKKVWSSLRVMLFMLKKKGISKRKLLLDLNLFIKRGKLAGKALQNLIFHHLSSTSPPPPNAADYQFTSLFSALKKHRNKKTSPPHPDGADDIIVDAAVIKTLEMLTTAMASPGFGKSPMVRQLRITDSPFPLSNGDEDSCVDEAAEKFILKFYSDLRRQD